MKRKKNKKQKKKEKEEIKIVLINELNQEIILLLQSINEQLKMIMSYVQMLCIQILLDHQT